MRFPLPREGFRDLSRRLRIAWLLFARLRLRRALFQAEAELGWLGWEQVDFFDLQVNEEIRKVREFENTQASLLNTAAELSGRKAALDEELAREKELHDEAQASLAQERAPIAAQFEEAETRRRQKLEAVERFDRALAEIARLEKQLEARSLSFMDIERPTAAIRAQARVVSDELARLPGERTHVSADRATASEEAARLESEIANFRAELRRIAAAASAARDRFAGASRRLAAEMRPLVRERKKSDLRRSHLDRKKQTPYRLIGACMADNGLAPRNQPEALEKVLALREREARLTEAFAELQAACAAADAGMLLAFYLLLAVLLVAVCVIACHFLYH